MAEPCLTNRVNILRTTAITGQEPKSVHATLRHYPALNAGEGITAIGIAPSAKA
jgi:hypothetical protein